MNLRLAQRSDIPAILEISNWAAINTPANFAIEPETLEAWLTSWDQTHTMYPWLVAEESSQIIGFAKGSPHRSRCAYAWSAEVTVYVHADHHGRGVGTALYSQLIPMLKAQGYVTLIAGITTPNPASQKLHESFGFKRIGVFERVGWKFGRWHDVGYWEMVLRDTEAPPPALQTVDRVLNESTAGSAARR
jgi:L-amino acid N-acyltransferase YncA